MVSSGCCCWGGGGDNAKDGSEVDNVEEAKVAPAIQFRRDMAQFSVRAGGIAGLSA